MSERDGSLYNTGCGRRGSSCCCRRVLAGAGCVSLRDQKIFQHSKTSKVHYNSSRFFHVMLTRPLISIFIKQLNDFRRSVRRWHSRSRHSNVQHGDFSLLSNECDVSSETFFTFRKWFQKSYRVCLKNVDLMQVPVLCHRFNGGKRVHNFVWLQCESFDCGERMHILKNVYFSIARFSIATILRLGCTRTRSSAMLAHLLMELVWPCTTSSDLPARSKPVSLVYNLWSLPFDIQLIIILQDAMSALL